MLSVCEYGAFVRLREGVEGMVPGLKDLPAGCRFQNRCPYRIRRCESEQPGIARVDAGHQVSCHRWREIEAGAA